MAQFGIGMWSVYSTIIIYQLLVALTIIAEHSYLLWDQRQSEDTNLVMTTMGLYKKYINHQSVVEAVDNAFREDNGCSFKWLKSHKRSDMRNALAKRLIQISLDNRLCRLNSEILLNHTYIYSIAKNPLMQEARLAVLSE